MEQVKQKQLGNYIFERTLGRGTFSKVKLAIHRPTGEYVAIKILNKQKIIDVADVQRVSREIHILKLIRHPNIIHLYEIIETTKYLFLVMELIQEGELFKYIVKKKRIDENQACGLFHQLINGVQYISKLGIVHRDLKPENLMLDYRNNLKIVDFGLSNTYTPGETLKTPCGSPCYAAPEMIKGQKYQGLKVDIWSSGVILFAMVCGCLPFDDENTSQLYKKIIAGKYTPSSSLSSSCKSLLSGILQVDPQKRFTVDQIRSHPWMSLNSTPDNKGIIIGLNRIPIEPKILKSVQQCSSEMTPDYVTKCVQTNRHNNATATYYLSFKKYLRNGGLSVCDMDSPNFDKTLLQLHKKSRDYSDNLLGSDAKTIKVNQNLFDSIKSPNRFSKKKTEKFAVQFNLNDGRKKSKKKSTLRYQDKSRSRDKLDQSFGRGRSRQTKPFNKISKKYRERFNKSLVSRSHDRQNMSLKPRKSIKKYKQSSSKNKSTSMMRSMSKDQNRSRLGQISNLVGLDSINISQSTKSYTRGKSISNNRRIVFDERMSFQNYTKRSKF